MAAPKGNKYAAGSSYDLIAIAKSLDEWSKRDDAMHLTEFALEQDVYPQRLFEWRDQEPKFADSLKKAKARIAMRLLRRLHDKINPYNYGVLMRYLPVYDSTLHDFERAEKKYESDLRKNENQQNNEQMQQASCKLDAVLDQVSKIQSARNIDKSKINND